MSSRVTKKSPLINRTLKSIELPNAFGGEDVLAAMEERMMDPTFALGRLTDVLNSYACATLDAFDILTEPRPCTVICCADHGVAEQMVSAYPQETTAQMVKSYLISQGAAANVFADFIASDLLVVDMGLKKPLKDLPGLLDRRIGNGTADFTQGPAMTREEAIRSIETGIKLAEACCQDYDCILPGEMGIANTTASAAICAVMCGISPEEATGTGTNISKERLAHKIAVVKKALAVNNPNPQDPIDVLAKVGGFELGAIAGLILGAAANRMAVILDGFNTGAAALIAGALSSKSRRYLIASQLSQETGHKAVLKKLRLTPVLDMHFALGEGCGSSLAADFLFMLEQIYTCTDTDNEDVSTADFHRETMPKEPPLVTNRTFDFYLNTMPELDERAMRSCRKRLDSLIKPLNSLGYLESIAVEVAGISGEERPVKDLSCVNLTVACHDLLDWQERLVYALAEYGESEVAIAKLRPNMPPTAAFDFGRSIAEDISFNSALMCISLSELAPDDYPGTLSKKLHRLLLGKGGTLRYAPDEFLSHLPKPLKPPVSAVMGAIIAATHNSSMVILDNEATEIIARYTEELCPAVRPYILHVQPALVQLDVTLGLGVVSAIGRRLVDISMALFNDMKTFNEAGVATAQDGPGQEKQ